MGCEDRAETISRYIDDELSPEERSAFEEHLKRCEECRRDLGEMRGTDGMVRKAVRSHRVGESFVQRVTRGMTRPLSHWLIWPGMWLVGIVAAAAAVAVVRFMRSDSKVERAAIVLQAPEGSFVADKKAKKGMEVPGGAVAGTVEAGLVLELAHARLYVGGSSEVRMDSSVEATLLSGEVFAHATGDLRLRIRPALSAKAERARFLARADGVTVVAGGVKVPFAGVDVDVPAGRRMRLGVSEFWMEDVDLRALRPPYVPDELLASPWPMVGGDERRSGFSPFPLPRAVEPGEVEELGDGLSSPVITWTGDVAATGEKGLHVGVRWAKLPGEPVGSPCAFERGAAVSVEKGVAFVEGGEFRRTLPCEPVAGCLISWGTLFVPLKEGLVAFRLDGSLLWAQPLAATDLPVSKHKGIVFAACRDGILRALDAATGEVLANSILRPEGFSSYPVIAPEGRCYAVSGSQLVWLERGGKTGVIDLPEAEYPVPPAIDSSGALYLCDGEGEGVLWKVIGEKTERVFDAGSGATA